MDKSSIGKWIRVQSYKHDGSLHRTWDNVMVIDVTDDYIVTGSCASRVVECDGRIWYTKEPAIISKTLKNNSEISNVFINKSSVKSSTNSVGGIVGKNVDGGTVEKTAFRSSEPAR